MQFSDSQLNRRLADRIRPDSCETGSDIWKEVASLSAIVSLHQRQLESIISSFPANDLGQPGYEAHRISHLSQAKSAEMLEKYKATAASKIVGALAIFLTGAFASGFISTIKSALGL